ncbi:DUF4179 domain-containing protein [Caloramator sp. mosi_1]|uniref:DUF4179 domain-containing protein n=1 Tax=Caloramator sp. mosi_1 TaxID=3023090 RepID=UPI00235F78F6|nr:DUF4179 domain-containing protein [Caloramator sp. mosi_1]WDC85094.1 DUF4179 domain-containing protein [Caloramator sp. mosi_1]
MATSAAIFIAVLIIIVNNFTVSAETMMKVPILRNIVEILKYDKGLEKSAKEGYVKDVSTFSEDKGVKLVVNNIAGHNKRFAILYSIETQKPYQFAFIENFVFFDEEGNKIEGLYNVMHSPKINKTNNIFTGTIDVEILEPNKIPEKIYLYANNIELFENDKSVKIDGNWKVRIDIPKFSEMPVKKYSIDKKVLVGDIEVSLGKVEITPTTCEIGVSFNNDKYTSFDLINPQIQTEDGEIYKCYGWVEGTKSFKYVYKFESPYFTKSKSLKLKFDGIYYKPNKDEYIVVDLENHKILDSSGYGIILKEIKYGNVLGDDEGKYGIDIQFVITDEQIVRNMQKYNIAGGFTYGEIYDQNGRRYDFDDCLWRYYEQNGEYIESIVIKKNKLSLETKRLKIKITHVLKGIEKPMEFEIK